MLQQTMANTEINKEKIKEKNTRFTWKKTKSRKAKGLFPIKKYDNG